MLEAGGERAEVEQVAAHVARLIRHERCAPEDIAIVWREPQGLFERCDCLGVARVFAQCLATVVPERRHAWSQFTCVCERSRGRRLVADLS